MSIEEEIFKRSSIDTDKLISYGFKKSSKCYEYETEFMSGEFKAVIKADENGAISGRVFDMENNEEYMPLRASNSRSSYSGIVKSNYEEILRSIKEKCTVQKYFQSIQANRTADLIFKQLQVKPDFPWADYKTYGVFRNAGTKKWFALIMDIDKIKIDEKSKTSERLDIINIKLDKNEIQKLLNVDGFYKAYHMNKTNWITIRLDETISDDIIMKYIFQSYGSTEPKSKKNFNNNKLQNKISDI